MTDNAALLRLLGLIKKAGKLEIGEEPAGAACRAKHAKLLIAASDASPNTFRRIRHFGEMGNVLWLVLPCAKEELGSVLGRSSCAMAAITDIRMALSLAQSLGLAEDDPIVAGLAAKSRRVGVKKHAAPKRGAGRT